MSCISSRRSPALSNAPRRASATSDSVAPLDRRDPGVVGDVTVSAVCRRYGATVHGALPGRMKELNPPRHRYGPLLRSRAGWRRLSITSRKRPRRQLSVARMVLGQRK